MGLFKDRNQKIIEGALRDSARNGSIKRKTVSCPMCGTRASVVFMGPNDSYTCKKCGHRIR